MVKGEAKAESPSSSSFEGCCVHNVMRLRGFSFMQLWINCHKQDVLFSPDSSDPRCVGSSEVNIHSAIS